LRECPSRRALNAPFAAVQLVRSLESPVVAQNATSLLHHSLKVLGSVSHAQAELLTRLLEITQALVELVPHDVFRPLFPVRHPLHDHHREC